MRSRCSAALLMPGGWHALGHACRTRAGERAQPRGAKRPKICLVLSGGGARGAAHVGVIKVLEEYRVPIDCIAGTSMGALVGAAYATGHDRRRKWRRSPRASPPNCCSRSSRRARSCPCAARRTTTASSSARRSALVGGKLKFAKGVVTGVQLETVLRQLSKAKGYHQLRQPAHSRTAPWRPTW